MEELQPSIRTIYVLTDSVGVVKQYSEKLSENILYNGIEIKTEINLDVVNLVDNYKLLNGELMELTEEEKEFLVKPQTTQSILNALNEYKHTYILFIDYDGAKQRTLPEDRVMILDCQQSLELKLRSEVMWKYPTKYVTVTDPQYFINMRMAIGDTIEKAFHVEYILTQEINTLTDEQLKTYDMETRFDEVFKSIG